MRVIALIEDPGIIRRMLEHLGLWVPLATERALPLGPNAWPEYAGGLIFLSVAEVGMASALYAYYNCD